ncbi:MAG: N-acetyl-alpha-D-glucosaminyl L-malate synthase BshA [Candidatus Bathyarchaeota archaeon]|nr:N-acetyl-alpha-D-glucosaminyl L-malate synthase BshA [Candidatus Bathyarchaeota archaeon]
MKIGLVCFPTVGGSGILATRLGVELSKRGHEIHLISYERPFAVQGMGQENVSVHLVSVPEYPLFKYPPYTVSLASRILQVSQEFDLDLINVHYAIPHSVSAFLAKTVAGVPYFVTFHGSDVTILGKDPSFLPVNAMSLENADGLTAVSKYLREQARETLGLKRDISVIPNFVNSDVFSPAEPDVVHGRKGRQVVIVHVSNFRPVKRIEVLVEAMSFVVQVAESTRLILVGEGSERQRIELLVKQLGLQKKVLMTGFRSDIPELLRCSDILVLCSDMEGAGLTLLEAMSCGLPVVATRVGGIPEIVEDGKNGFLVTPRSPEELADRILRLNFDGELRLKMGEEARRTVLEHFTVDKVVPMYEEAYRRVVSD